jgi:hypothetical protein
MSFFDESDQTNIKGRHDAALPGKVKNLPGK